MPFGVPTGIRSLSLNQHNLRKNHKIIEWKGTPWGTSMNVFNEYNISTKEYEFLKIIIN